MYIYTQAHIHASHKLDIFKVHIKCRNVTERKWLPISEQFVKHANKQK